MRKHALSERRSPAEPRDPRCGFTDLADFALAVRGALTPHLQTDPRLSPLATGPDAYTAGNGVAGEGFILPVDFRDRMWEAIVDMDDVMMAIDLEPSSARQVDAPKDETTPWGASGIKAVWRTEGSQMDPSTLLTTGEQMNLHEIYAFVLATDELVEDSPRLAARLTRKSAQAIGWTISDAIIYGNGTGRPLGWFNSPALISVAKESGQAADTIKGENLANMAARLATIPGDRPHWLVNRDCIPQLAAATIGGQRIWAGTSEGDQPGGAMLGYPIKWSEHTKSLGDKGDVHLVSPFGYYGAYRASGIQFAASMHLYFDYRVQAFRWTFRFNGQPHLSAPIAPANGGNTKSHFVVLEDRA